MYLLSTTSLLNAAPYFPAHTVGLALASPVLEYGLIRFVSGGESFAFRQHYNSISKFLAEPELSLSLIYSSSVGEKL